MIEAIDRSELARVTGGLVSGDGGCVRPPPKLPFPPPRPSPPFDWTKIALPSAA